MRRFRRKRRSRGRDSCVLLTPFLCAWHSGALPAVESLGSSGRGHQRCDSSMSYTGYWVSNGHICGPRGYTQHWIQSGHIYGPRGYTGLWIQDASIYGPRGYTQCWIQDDFIYGEKGNLPW